MMTVPRRWTIPLAEGPVGAWIDRSLAALVAASAAAALVGLRSVVPDPRGHGTHEQFGMSPCGWPLHYGWPCPTCGCTTAACLLVHGDLAGAVVVQPFGAALAVVMLGGGAVAGCCLLAGQSFVDVVARLPVAKLMLATIAALLLAWAYKCATWPPAG